MEYIKETDYEYITNKYHDKNAPFDPFSRFIRRDEIFSPETGLSAEEIYAGIMAEDEKISLLPHPIRKARAFEYVLKNTRISCDARDRFPAINMVDRPLNKTLVQKWEKEVFSEILPDMKKKMDYYEKSGAVTIWPDFDHSVPVWDRVFSLGFAGLLKESEDARKNRSLNEEENAFFESIKITYSAIIEFIKRLENLASSTKGSEKMAEALKNTERKRCSYSCRYLWICFKGCT